MPTSETDVFRVDNSLAMRLVGNCKLPRDMRIPKRRDGDRIILEPITEAWPPRFLAAVLILPRFCRPAVKQQRGYAGCRGWNREDEGRAGQKEAPRWCWDQALIGGQTARQSTTPSREVGRRAWWVPQLRCGVEHGASLPLAQAPG